MKIRVLLGVVFGTIFAVLLLARMSLSRATDAAASAIGTGVLLVIAWAITSRLIEAPLAEMARQLAHDRRRDERLTKLILALAEHGNVAGVADSALRSLVTSYGALGGVLWLATGEANELEVAAYAGIDPSRLRAGGSAAAREALASGQATELRDLDGGAHAVVTALAEVAPRAIVIASIPDHSGVRGVVELSLGRTSEVRLDELASELGRLGLALAHVRASEQMVELARTLTDREAELSSMFEALADGVTLVDTSNVVTLANRAAQEMFGEIVGQSVGALRERFTKTPDGAALPDDASAVLDNAAAELRGVRRGVIDRAGVRRTLLVNTAPVRRGGLVVGRVYSTRDITAEEALRTELSSVNEELVSRNEELKAQEEELRAQSEELAARQAEAEQRNAELARASRLKSEFLASMSHELRTPLNAIIGFSELLSDGAFGSLPPKQHESVCDILSAGRQLLTLVNDILDLSKIEAGHVQATIARVDVADPVADALSLVVSATRKKSLEIDDAVPKGRFFVAADPDKVRQVLANLLSNAAKFTRDGGRIGVSAEDEGGLVRVLVRDTGIGISREDASRLFLPFSQLDAGFARRYGGTGLGLSISKRLVELMGGTIGFSSEPGVGSTFYFTLPRDAGAARPHFTKAPPGASLAPNGAARPPMVTPTAAPRRVLVADDNDMNRHVMLLMMTGLPCEIVEATDGEVACKLALERHVDVIFMDIQMPIMDGVRALEALRQNPETRAIPVIAVTAHAMEGDREQFIVQGFDGYVSKPVSRATLLAALDGALGGATWRGAR